MNGRWFARDVALIALLAAAASLAYGWTHLQHVGDDSPDYIIAAYNLASGRGLMRIEPPRSAGPWHFTPRDSDWMLNDIQGDVETGRTPVYPTFLALFRLFNLPPAAVVVVQHALRVLIPAGTYVLALRFTERRPIAVISGLWIALEPQGIQVANQLLTETLFTALLLGAMWLTVTAMKQRAISLPRAAAVGLLSALATLTRPVSIAWPVVAVLAMMFVRRRAIVILVLALAATLPVLAWAMRNQRAAGVFQVSLISSMGRLFFAAAGAEAMGQPGDFDENLHRLRGEYRERVRRAAEELSSRNRRPITSTEKLALYDAEARRVLKANLDGALRNTFWRLRQMFIPVYRCNTCGMRGYLKDVLLLAHVGALTLATIGLFYLARRDPPSAALLATTILYFAIVTAAAGSSGGRFRVPIEPYYALFIAAGGVALVDRWRDRRLKRLASVPS